MRSKKLTPNVTTELEPTRPSPLCGKHGSPHIFLNTPQKNSLQRGAGAGGHQPSLLPSAWLHLLLDFGWHEESWQRIERSDRPTVAQSGPYHGSGGRDHLFVSYSKTNVRTCDNIVSPHRVPQERQVPWVSVATLALQGPLVNRASQVLLEKKERRYVSGSFCAS